MENVDPSCSTPPRPNTNNMDSKLEFSPTITSLAKQFHGSGILSTTKISNSKLGSPLKEKNLVVVLQEKFEGNTVTSISPTSDHENNDCGFFIKRVSARNLRRDNAFHEKPRRSSASIDSTFTSPTVFRTSKKIRNQVEEISPLKRTSTLIIDTNTFESQQPQQLPHGILSSKSFPPCNTLTTYNIPPSPPSKGFAHKYSTQPYQFIPPLLDQSNNNSNSNNNPTTTHNNSNNNNNDNNYNNNNNNNNTDSILDDNNGSDNSAQTHTPLLFQRGSLGTSINDNTNILRKTHPLPTIPTSTHNFFSLSQSTTSLSICKEDERVKCLLPTVSGSLEFNLVDGDIVERLMSGEFDNLIKGFLLIDCRYGYEYQGGRVKGAINMGPSQVVQYFKDLPPPVRTPNEKRNAVLVFHCEFSSARGPECLQVLRDLDYRGNLAKGNQWPLISYPDVYLLKDGYKKFYETHPHLCEGGYVPERHEAYEQIRAESRRTRKTEKIKMSSKSFEC